MYTNGLTCSHTNAYPVTLKFACPNFQAALLEGYDYEGVSVKVGETVHGFDSFVSHGANSYQGRLTLCELRILVETPELQQLLNRNFALGAFGGVSLVSSDGVENRLLPQVTA